MERIHGADARESRAAASVSSATPASRAAKLRLAGVDLFELRPRDVIAHRVRQDEIAVREPLHQRAGAQAIGAVIGKVRFADHEQAGDGAHQVIIHPQAAHGVVDRRIDAHRNLVRIFVGDALVHLEQIAVALANHIHAQPLDGIREIEIDAQPGLAHAAAFVAHGFRVARCHVARDQVAEARIAALQIIIALGFRESDPAGACRPPSAAPRCGRRCAAIRSSASASIDNRPTPECRSDGSA